MNSNSLFEFGYDAPLPSWAQKGRKITVKDSRSILKADLKLSVKIESCLSSPGTETF